MRKTLMVGCALLCAASATAQTTVPSRTVVSEAQRQAGEWARQAVALVVSKGLVVGRPKGRFDWRSPATRQEVAAILSRLLERYPLEKLKTMLSSDEMAVLTRGVKETATGLQELRTQVTGLLGSVRALQQQVEQLKGLGTAAQSTQQAVTDLDGRLDTLESQATAAEQTNQQAVTDLAGRLDTLESQATAAEQTNQQAVTDLAGRLDTLESQATAAEQTSQQAVTDLAGRLDTLESQATAAEQTSQSNEQAITDLSGRLDSLQSAQADQSRQLTDAQGALTQLGGKLDQDMASLAAQLAALQGSLQQTQSQVGAQASSLQAELAGLNQRLQAQEAITAEAARVRAQEADRPRWYVGVGAYRVGIPSTGTEVRVLAGNARLVGNLGLRLTGDFGSRWGNAVDMMGTYTVNSGALSGYAGVGVGRNFTREQTFGHLTLGASYQVTRQFAVFAEGRESFSFNVNQHFGSVTFGVQYRF